METKLLPCPFCGGEAKVGVFYGDLYFAMCCNCGVYTKFYGTEAEAIEAWNTRAERSCKPSEPQKCLSGTDCPAWKCSECDELFELGASYCSNCGAKVVG
jgi:Lar family restriction alleviation protein